MKQTLRLRGGLCPRPQPIIHPFYKLFITFTIVLVSCVCSRAQVPASSPEAGPAAGAVEQVQGISGVVFSTENKKPLQNATVKNSATGKITSTGPQGHFTIHAKKGNTLLITYLGYESKEVTVTNEPYLEIGLSKVLNELDETIVIGYGTTSKRYNTGSVSKVTAEEIGKQPVSNPLAALQGRAAGVYINTENGLPGGGFTVQVRGMNSIAAGRDPLYIIDGVPQSATSLNSFAVDLTNTAGGAINPLSTINPQDIQSIEVLKDADATAIYGSRGANGVVLITTKRSQSSASKVEVNIFHGISRAAKLPSYLNLEQYLTLRREAYKNDQLVPSADPNNSTYAPDLMVWDTTRSTDWVEYMIGGNAPVTQAQLSISGGSPSTRFLISTDYRKEGSIFPGDFDYQKMGTRFSAQHKSPNDKLEIMFTGNFNYDHNNQIAFPVNIMLTLPPNFPLYEPSGALNWNSVSLNPIALLQQKQSYKTYSTRLNGTLRYRLLKDLSMKANVGYTNTFIKQINTFPLSSQNPNSYRQPRNYARFGNNVLQSFIIEPQADYKVEYGRSSFSALLGFSYQTNIADGQFIEGSDYANEFLLKSLGAAGTITSKNDVLTAYKYASIFGRLTYSFARKYIVNVTARRDGSSRFGPGNRFGNFGAIGGAWVFTEERGLTDKLPFLSFGKVRSSYGLTGNDQIADYQYLSTYRTSQTYQDISTLNPARIANANYRWEVNKKFDLGIDLGMWNDKVLLTADYFRNISSNQLVSYPLPYMSGPFGSYQANLPAKVENRGWEFDISSKNIQGRAVNWTSTFNISLPKNKLLEFPGLEKTSYANKLFVGEDLSSIKGFQNVGISAETGLRQYKTKDGELTTKPTRLVDYVTIGKTSPYFYGGLSNTLSYKGFQLDVFFQFAKQSVKGAPINPGLRNNTYVGAMERWQHPGDEKDIAKSSTRPDRNINISDVSVVDARYIRLKNVSISYLIPHHIINTLHMKQFKVYAEGQNLLTIMKDASIYDPEIGVSGIPPMRTFVLGVQLVF